MTAPVRLPSFSPPAKEQAIRPSLRSKQRLQHSQRICSSSSSSMSNQWRKSVWLLTESKQVMTTAVEGGWNTFIFTSSTRGLAREWSSLARIKPLFLEDGEICDEENKRVAFFEKISTPQQVQELATLIGRAEIIVMDPCDWQIIPAENMVAAFQGSNASIFATARNAADAKVLLEALEKGTDGIVLRTEDPADVFELKNYFSVKLECSFSLIEAVITRVEPVGVGDRVCVDLCSILSPGEGLLVGSFAKALFLVHSECLESSYIASRPFRVNAGPVHAYVAVPGGRTRYLCELKSGDEVMVVNREGRARTAVVGRVKIESRPLILIEAEQAAEQGFAGSLILQNAETVCLVQPGEKAGALPVSKMKIGDSVLACVQDAARHAGMKIQEFILEK